jgi:hypothetical protein
MDDLNTAAQPQEAAEAAPPPPPRFVDNGRPRFRVVPLEWPIDYDGKTYSEITVRRMTTAEVVAFVDQMRDDLKEATLPMFDVPHAVIDALDPDDADEVNKAVNDFLPRALRLGE